MAYSRERQRKYAATENGRERRRLASQRYRESEKGRADYVARQRSPEGRARVAANNAVKSGKLQRQPCQGCGTTEKVEKHHHKGYEPEFWLDVEWYCRPCHAGLHLS